MLGGSSVEIGVDVGCDRMVLGEVSWRRGGPLRCGRWAERTGAQTDANTSDMCTQQIEWVKSTLASWRCNPKALSLAIADTWVDCERISLLGWLSGEDLAHALRDDVAQRHGLSSQDVVLDYCAATPMLIQQVRDAGGAAGDESLCEWVVCWMAQAPWQAFIQPWMASGLPLQRVEPQSFALIRALGSMHQLKGEPHAVAPVASLWVDLQPHGVLALWLERGNGPHRYWWSAPSQRPPPVCADPLAVGGEPMPKPSSAESDPVEALLRWVHARAAASEHSTVTWCVRGEGDTAQALRSAVPLALEALRWSPPPQALGTEAWPVAAAAWGVAWSRDA